MEYQKNEVHPGSRVDESEAQDTRFHGTSTILLLPRGVSCGCSVRVNLAIGLLQPVFCIVEWLHMLSELPK